MKIFRNIFKKKPEEKRYSWDDITIAQYRRIVGLDSTDEDYAFELVAVFENTTLKDILERPIDETLRCTAALNKFVTGAPKRNKIKSKYTLGEQVYELSSNPADITTAQYFDFVNTPKDIPENLSKILAVFMVPQGKQYNTDYDLQKAVSDIEKYMKIEDAMGVCYFFQMLFQVFSNRIMKRTKRALKQAKKEMPEHIKEIEKVERKLRVLESLDIK